MKALIFNSGLGRRMGAYTKFSPKSMLKLKNGETVLFRQLRILQECNINDIIITTGPFADQLKVCANKFQDLRVTFVENKEYDTTNAIYSFYLASKFLNDDFITLHGDLVFTSNTLKHILADPHGSCVAVDSHKKLPEKDFKGRIVTGTVQEISVHTFGEDCVSLQPLYKISKNDLDLWAVEVKKMVESGNKNVYAEEAFNKISTSLKLYPVDCVNYFLEEIDTPEDYQTVSNEISLIDVDEQTVLHTTEDLIRYLEIKKSKNLFVVASKRSSKNPLVQILQKRYSCTLFNNFSSNPHQEEVLQGKDCFLKKQYDTIISFGGGSAIDVGKCILAFSYTSGPNYISGNREYQQYTHIAIPTTAGTGSESTRYATLYYQGKKYSVIGEDEIPNAIMLNPEYLLTMPDNIKIATMFDALCQCIESLWSKFATEKSIQYATQGIKLILNNIEGYYSGRFSAYAAIQMAANYSGKAINISQTTAAHALSYVLTSEKGIPHGIAVTYCIIPLWKYLLDYAPPEVLMTNLINVSKAFGCSNVESYAVFFNIVQKYGDFPKLKLNHETAVDYSKNINLQRLQNFPIALTEKEIQEIYQAL